MENMKMERQGKVREFCQSGKVGTMVMLHFLTVSRCMDARAVDCLTNMLLHQTIFNIEYLNRKRNFLKEMTTIFQRGWGYLRSSMRIIAVVSFFKKRRFQAWNNVLASSLLEWRGFFTVDVGTKIDVSFSAWCRSERTLSRFLCSGSANMDTVGQETSGGAKEKLPVTKRQGTWMIYMLH